MSAGTGPLEPAASALAEADLPPELREEIQACFRRTVELAAQDRQLEFGRDRVTNRIAVNVRDLDGELIRVITCAEALDVMAGSPLL